MKKNNKHNKQVENAADPLIKYPHGIPMTRREMLQAGAIQFAATMTLPSIYALLGNSAEANAALVCPKPTSNDLALYIEITLAGGAGMAANFVPHDAGMQPLPTYSILGLGRAPVIDRTTFGNGAPFAGGAVSGILTGIQAAAKAETLLKTAMVGNPLQSGDDSSNNKLSISGAVTKAGLKGLSLPNLGTTQSASGGRHQPAYVVPPAPLLITSYDDIANAINVAGSLSALGTNQKRKLFEMVMNLSTRQIASLTGMTGGEQLGTLAACASDTNMKLVGDNKTGTSPLDNPAFSTVWGINANTSKSSRDFVFASMVYNAFLGNAGTVNLSLGGYDYHGNARTATTAQDVTAGTVVGKVLESAAVMAGVTNNRKVFVTLTTDGAVGSPASDSAAVNFSSDRGVGSVAYMFAFDPAKLPQTSGFQVGQFTTNQAADTSFISGSPELAAAAMFANYMSFNNKLAAFDTVVPRVFSPDQLSQVVKIFG